MWTQPLKLSTVNLALNLRTSLPLLLSTDEKKRRRFCIDTEVRCVGAHPLFGPLSRRGLNPIKPVYDPDRPDGRLNLTASAFNQLGQYASSPGRRGYCYA